MGTIPTKFMFPQNNYLGNPCGSWTEYTAPNLLGDRKYIISSGPFSLAAKSMIELEYAQVWSVDSSAASSVIHLASVNKLISDVQKVRNFYKTASKPGCIGSTIGIDEQETNNNILIFPNPANSILNIKTELNYNNSLVEITDVPGRTLFSHRYNNLNTSVNISELSNGIYFLSVTSGNNKIVKKFIKE